MNGGYPTPGAQLLAMSVAGRAVAIAAADVAQVLPMLPLWRPPTAPLPLCGFVESGGIVLPVLSTRALLCFGDEKNPDLYAHIVRIKLPGRRSAGLLVDRAEGFVVPETLEAVSTADTLNGCAKALFAYQGAIGWLIDPKRLLEIAEGEMLAALIAEADRRRAEWTAVA